MNLNHFNLCHLLELGFRFPEVGAVNFNVVYLILKTIIKKHGLETLKPAEVLTLKENRSDELVSYLQGLEEAHDQNESDLLPTSKKRKTETCDVDETIDQLTKRISKMEEILTSQGHLSTEEEEVAPVVKEEKDSTGKQKDTEGLKQIDLGNIYADIAMLKASNSSLMDKCLDLQNEFDTVVNEYSQLGLQVEEIDKAVAKTTNIGEEVESLKEHVEKLDLYIYSERYEPKDDFNAPHIVPTPAPAVEEEKEQMMKKQFRFTDVVRELMSQPKGPKVQLVERAAEEAVEDSSQVKPTTKKAYERFLEIAKKVKSTKNEDPPPVEDKKPVESKKSIAAKKSITAKTPTESKALTDRKTSTKDQEELIEVDVPIEEAETIPIAELQEQENLTVSDYTTTEVRGHFFRSQPKKKFRALVHAITLAKGMQKPPESEEVVEEVPPTPSPAASEEKVVENQPEIKSEESLEVPLEQSPSTCPLEEPSTSQQEEKVSSKELKRWCFVFVRNQMKGTEENFSAKFQLMEKMQQDISELILQVADITDRLEAEETSHTGTKETVSNIEKAILGLESGFQEVKTKLQQMEDARKMQTVTRKDLGTLEDRVYEVNKVTRKDISAFENFINITLRQFQGDLNDKASNFEVDIRLEPLATRLKKLEKLLKEMCLKLQLLEFEHIGPIDIKQYVHCQDGTRVKPVQRLPSHCLSETQSALSLASAQSLLDENIPQKILEDVQRRLEQTSVQETKRCIARANQTKPFSRKDS